MGVWPGWEADVLDALHAPMTSANVQWMDEWQRWEGGSARFNPWNTTQPEPGATNYNTAGVRNYPSAKVGTDATVTTLTNGRYPSIVAALRSGFPLSADGQAAIISELRTWGTVGFADALQARATSAGQATAPPPSPSGGGGVSATAAGAAASALGGWHSVNIALSRTIPRQLYHGAKLTNAAVTRLGHRRRA